MKKYIATVENTWIFQQTKYGKERLVGKSYLTLHPFSYQTNQEIFKQFTVLEAEFEDGFLHFGSMTDESAEVFQINLQKQQPYNSNKRVPL